MKRSVLIPIALVLLLMAALVPATFAAQSADTIVGENEVINNDVVVFEGDLEVHEGAVVNGDVAVFNGDARVDGQINGSLTLFNGDLVAGAEANVSGECVLLNGLVTGLGARDRTFGPCTAIQSLQLAPLAELAPNLFRNFENLQIPNQDPELMPLPAEPAMPAMPEMPAVPGIPHQGRDSYRGPSFFSRLMGVMASSLLFGFLGLLTAAIMPNQLRQIVTTARDKSLVSGAAGALTAVAVPSLIVLLIPVSIILTFVCIGLLGFPIMFLLGLALVAGGFLGWVAVGTWLGIRLFGRGKDERLMRSAALGTGLLSLIVGVMGLVSFGIGGAILSFVVSCIGLGAVALTQFGMKPYPRRPETGAPSDGPDADKLDHVLGTLPPEEAAA